MIDKYIAYKYYDDIQWGVVDQKGAILYEAMFDTLEIAAYVAKRHSENDNLTWDDIAADVKAMELASEATEPTAAAQGEGVDDSGYSELLDELSGRIKALERALHAAETGLEDIANWHFEEADKQTNAYKRYGSVIEETAKEFARRANVTLTKMGMERKVASGQQAAQPADGEG